MALSGYSVPETVTDDDGNTLKGITVTVTGPSSYSGTAVTDASTGVLRLGPLPPGDYTVTYNGRSVIVPVFASSDDILAAAGTGGGGTAGVSSFNTRTGAVTLSKADVTGTGLAKADVGLGNVDNTSDTAKPVSTAQQTALDGKQPLDSDLTAIAALDSTVAGALATDGAGWVRKTYAQLKTALGLVKADVGLGSVDNTADTAKPVSTAQQAALDLKAPLASPALTGSPTVNGAVIEDRTHAAATYAPGAIPSLDGDGNVILTIPAGSKWGIDGTGTPYYDPDGAAAGEEALLVVGTDGTTALVTIGA